MLFTTMISRIVINKKIFILILLWLLLFPVQLKADIPHIKKYKINKIKGYVLFENSKGKTLIDNAEIIIRSYKNESNIIAKATTNKMGYFEVNNIHSGIYWLNTTSMYLGSHSMIIDLRAKSKSNKVIIIYLAITNGNCCETELIDEAIFKKTWPIQ